MSLSAASLFPLLLLTARAAAVSTEGWPLTPEESVRLEAEHAATCASMEAQFEKVDAQREAFKDAADPDEALDRWSNDANAMQPLIVKIHAIVKRHNIALRETEMSMVITSIGGKPQKDGAPHALPPEYQVINTRNNEMGRRAAKLQKRWDNTHARLDEERKARTVRLKQEAENRLLVRVVGGAGAVLLVLALWAARRYRTAERRA